MRTGACWDTPLHVCPSQPACRLPGIILEQQQPSSTISHLYVGRTPGTFFRLLVAWGEGLPHAAVPSELPAGWRGCIPPHRGKRKKKKCLSVLQDHQGKQEASESICLLVSSAFTFWGFAWGSEAHLALNVRAVKRYPDLVKHMGT